VCQLELFFCEMDMSTVDPQGPQAHVPHRWYEAPRMDTGASNLMAPEEMEVFFPSSLDSNSNRARSYYQAAAQMHSPYANAATHGQSTHFFIHFPATFYPFLERKSPRFGFLDNFSFQIRVFSFKV